MSNQLSLKLTIGHVRYINILTWLRGFQVKPLYLVLFSLYLSLFWELRDKGNLKNLQFWPESLWAMLESWYIGRGLFKFGPKKIFERSSHWKHKIIPPSWIRPDWPPLKFLKLLCFTILESGEHLLNISTPAAAN